MILISTRFKLTPVGDCDKPRDIGVSNDSLYYSTAVDIACDLLSKCTYSILYSSPL